MEKETLLIDFMNEFKLYSPDWKKIVEVNQFPDKYSDEQMRLLKLKKFGNAISHFRKNYPTGSKTLRQFAELVPFSHTYIDKIEKNKIKTLEVSKLEIIAKDFSSSIAYLIGLVKEPHEIPSKIETYFWEHPNSKYKLIEEEIYKALPGEKRLTCMIQVLPGLKLDELKERICQLIGTDYELANSLYSLLSSPQKKRYNIIKIFEYLKNI